MKLSELKGVGEKRVEQLNLNGIHTPDHIVSTYPKRYVFRALSTLEDANEDGYFYLQGKIVSNPSVFFIRKNLSKLSFRMVMEGIELSVLVFNQHYLKKTLRNGSYVVVYAKVDHQKRSLTAQKVTHRANFKEGFEPVYNLEGISDKTFLKIVRQTYDILKGHFKETLPLFLRERYRLLDIESLMKEVHEPSGIDAYKQVKRRLKYEELFTQQLTMQYLRHVRKQGQKAMKTFNMETVDAFIRDLPFSLTSHQTAAIDMILKDLQSALAMHRLLQGDTGSGKTIVAAVSAYACIQAGFQVAFMAPTEILARQHYASLKKLFEGKDVEVAYLSNNISPESIQSVINGLSDQSIHLVVGTHKLFSTETAYANLGLVITDEQHRFGVNQRRKLRDKGADVDSLHLSATPIPRTLSKTLYGDMDISSLRERPKHRKATTTRILPFDQASHALDAVKTSLEKGEQVFVVSPNIESNERVENGAKALYRSMKKRYPHHRVALVHGQQHKETQEHTLMRFKAGKIDLLVATTVIEVGIDVPGATLMVVYHAERMGLAQLHQLRGRVGRGDREGMCYLLYVDSEDTAERLGVIETTTDGFKLSEYDLSFRGHGDLIGTIQSGYLPFTHASLPEDQKILEVAHTDAKNHISDLLGGDEAFKRLKKIILTKIATM